MSRAGQRRRQRNRADADRAGRPDVRGGEPPRYLILAAIFIGATLERLWFRHAWGQNGSLTNPFYYGDATRFVDYAVAIAHGQAYDNGIPYHPPGWPLIVAAMIRLSGSVPVHAIALATAVASGGSVAVAAMFAGEVAGLGALIAVGFLGTFHFGHLVEASVAASEPVYGVLVVATVWGAWRWLRDPGPRSIGWAATCGASAGAAMLVRAEFVAAALAFAAVALGYRRARREIIAYAAAFALVLLPTTVWHWRSLSAFNAAHSGRVAGPLPRFVPVTSYGPFNFAMANHDEADGGPNRDHPMLALCSDEGERDLAAGQIDLACPAVYDLYVNGYLIGARWIVEHPAAALSLAASKVSYTIGFLAHGYLLDDMGASLTGTRRRVDVLDPEARWLIPVHLLLAAAGIAALRRQPIALAVLAAPLGAFVASVLLFYGYVRLGVAYLPVIWVLQGAGVSRALAAAGARETRRTIAVAMIAFALIVAIEGFRRMPATRLTLRGATLPDGSLMQDETLQIYDTATPNP